MTMQLKRLLLLLVVLGIAVFLFAVGLGLLAVLGVVGICIIAGHRIRRAFAAWQSNTPTESPAHVVDVEYEMVTEEKKREL